jgi:tryptophan synthase/tryptophan synthase beta chain
MLNYRLEPCHAFAECIKIAPKLKKDQIIIVNNCGEASKDKNIFLKELGYYPS